MFRLILVNLVPLNWAISPKETYNQKQSMFHQKSKLRYRYKYQHQRLWYDEGKTGTGIDSVPGIKNCKRFLTIK